MDDKENIKLAIKWNEIDFAKEELKKMKDKIQEEVAKMQIDIKNQVRKAGEIQEAIEKTDREITQKNIFDQDDFNELLELALIENRAEFVNLLLDNCGFNLNSFLNSERLMKLYNNETVITSNL